MDLCRSRGKIWLRILTGLMIAFLFSCRLEPETRTSDAISFDKLYDSLKVYDSVVVVFFDSNSVFLDTVFNGKVDSRAKISELKVDGWDGGAVHIRIFGFMDSVLVYEVEKQFDGRNEKTAGTIVKISPLAALYYPQSDINLPVGDSIPIPEIKVQPDNLSDKGLVWESSDPSILQITQSRFFGKSVGPAKATAKLRADGKTKFEILVKVSAKSILPIEIDIPKDTLYLVAGGATLKAPLAVIPSNSDTRIAWSIRDSTIAKVDGNGVISGIKKGSTVLRASSEANGVLRDSTTLIVSDSVSVKSIAFERKPLTLYVGGVSDTLSVSVFPLEANPSVEFTVLKEGVVTLVGTVVSPIATGIAAIVARSTYSPEARDTLYITVLERSTIDRVSIGQPAASEVFIGGEPIQLIAKVEPAKSPQQIQWKSADKAKAGVDVAGRVSGFAPGLVTIFAVSAADSSKKDSATIQVRRDMPQLIIGQDTTVPLGKLIAFNPVARKISGKIVQFKWDLDGDQKWDDSSDAVKTVSMKYDTETPVQVRFYVKDNQGNDTLASKRVRPVRGAVLIIESPLDYSYSRISPVKIVWTINGIVQDTLQLEKLKPGLNEIARSSQDSAGQSHSVLVRITYDTVPPVKPAVSCPRLVNTSRPGWTWATKGDGAGFYRYTLDNGSVPDPETKDTAFSVPDSLTEGVHSLSVQERDLAGNWSEPGNCSVIVDLTVPKPPVPSLVGAAITNVRRPKFTWHTGGGGAGYQYRIDMGERVKGLLSATDSDLVAGADLSHGPHSFLLRETDSAGNWSEEAKLDFTIDTIAPGVPKVNGSSVTNAPPTWSWSSGGGGQGLYRSKVNNPDLTIGAKEASDTSFALSSFENGMIYIIYVQERDIAGNWSGSGQFAIKVDTSGPSSPIVGSSAGALTNNPVPKWTWKSGGGGIATFQYSLDQPDITKGIETRLTELSIHLSNGQHTLLVREKDSVGNWSSTGFWILVVDTIGPGVPVVSLNQKSPTTITRPTWTWKSGGSGRGVYRYKLDDGDLTQGATQGTEVEYLAKSDLPEGKRILFVQEQDSAGNWSGSGTGAITLDFTGPNKPVLDMAVPVSPVNSMRPIWSWTTGGNGGSGSFRLKVNDSDMASGAIPAAAGTKTYSPGSDLPAEGAYTLFVQEQDSAGNWSPIGKRTLYCLKSGLVGGAVSSTDANPLEIIASATGAPFLNIGGSPGIVKTFDGSAWVNTSAVPSGTGGGMLRRNPASGMPSFLYTGGDGMLHLANYSPPFWGEPGSAFPYTYTNPSYSFAYGRVSIPYIAANTDTILYTYKYSSAIWNQAYPPLNWKKNITLTSIAMEFDSLTDIPYVHFRCGWSDPSSPMEIWRYRGAKWEKLSSTGLPLNTPAADRLAVNKFGEPHLVGMDFNNGSARMFVKKYSGSEWKMVGLGFVSDNAAGEGVYSIAFNSSGNPVVAFNESGFVTVYAFTGLVWKKMGTAGASRQFVQIDLSIGPNDVAYVAHGGVPYVYKVGFDP